MTPRLTGDTGQLAAIQTIRFGVDGNTYEIDLSTRHASELRSMAGRYIRAARKIEPAPSPARRQQQRQPRAHAQMDRTPLAARDEPAINQGIAESAADVRGGEHGLTDREKQELRTIADAARPQRSIVAGRLRTKGLAERDSAGNWWLTDAGRRELVSA
jgi:hypothetical protein